MCSSMAGDLECIASPIYQHQQPSLGQSTHKAQFHHIDANLAFHSHSTLVRHYAIIVADLFG